MGAITATSGPHSSRGRLFDIDSYSSVTPKDLDSIDMFLLRTEYLRDYVILVWNWCDIKVLSEGDWISSM